MTADGSGALTLVLETDDGVFLRRISPASALAADADPGPAAEDATRQAAAVWGLPDFVFRSALHASGSGTRELGDAIVVTGNDAVVIQVKARAGTIADDNRERSWLDKRIDKAARQAAGTIRKFASKPSFTLINERGAAVEISGADKNWVSVVVLDHPGLPGYTPTCAAIVLLRRDWEFLFEQLKSTTAVVRYLHRVSGDTPIPLGEEPVRYYQLATADAAATPAPHDPRLAAAGGRPMSTPLLPQMPAGHDDRRNHLVIRSVLEDLARCPVPEGATAAEMIEILAAVDTLEVGYRSELGRDILSWMHDLARAQDDQVQWHFRHINGVGRVNLIFAATTRYDEANRAYFATFISLRHQQLLDAIPELEDVRTVGVLLTLRSDGRRPWDTSMAATQGNQGFTPEDRTELEGIWPSPYDR